MKSVVILVGLTLVLKCSAARRNYGKCGISGNTNSNQDGVANKGAWPWLGWIGVFQNPKSMISCGGALLCDKWFVTLANCVTEKTDVGITTLEQRINLYLGDQDNLKIESTEMMVAVKQVHVHPNYTGAKNEYGVIPFDIALLELGEDNTTIPKLNKFIRPLCFLDSRDKPNYDVGRFMLSILKSQNHQLKAQIAGWGHMGNQQIFKPKVFPWQKLKQVERSLQTDHICKRRYPNLDTDMYICVGQVHKPDMETCYGDIGGPLMALMPIKRYTFLGLALKTKECTKLYEFSLFLNILHPDINDWIQKQLRGCNRINEPNPYVYEVEEPVDAENKTEAGRENDEDGLDSKNGDGDQGGQLISDADAEKEEDDEGNVAGPDESDGNNQACENVSYGNNCQWPCGHCYGDQPCNYVDGTCDRCDLGYLGELCETECISGTCGQDCSTLCGLCLKYETCNHVTGLCSTGCAAGRQGDTCKQECGNYTFGVNCRQQCHCVDGKSCDSINGECEDGLCAEGFFGADCQQNNASSDESDGKNKCMIIGVVSGVACIIIVLLVAGVCFLKRRKSSKKVTNPTDEHQYEDLHINLSQL